MTANEKFLNAMRSVSLAPAKGEIISDGILHRYRVDGDKTGSRNGWYVFHSSPIPGGAFGSWRTGETHTWRDKEFKCESPAALAESRRQMAAMHAARMEAAIQVTAAAQKKALKLFSLARPAAADHPYLVRKKVKAWGIRQLRDMLLIPARDVAGCLHTLQFIGQDGSKRFLTGGRYEGCYCAIGRLSDTVLIAEGYATAASVFEATGHATAIAFSAGNLEPVARSLREKFPGLRIIICADNDAATPGNPGLTKALEAARAVGGLIAKPIFEGAPA